MPDEKFEKKWQELQGFVPFLQRLINSLRRQTKDNSKAVHLEKMEMLQELLTKRDKNKLKYETLIKCENLLNKIYKKVEKLPPKPVTMSTEVVEILEPDSPPSNYQNTVQNYRPIEIPTERELSPVSEKKVPDEPKVVISSDLSLEELLKQRDLLENKIFNINSNSNSSNEVAIVEQPSVESGFKKILNTIINYDHFDIESINQRPSTSSLTTNLEIPFSSTLTKLSKTLQDNHEGNERIDSPKNRPNQNESYKSQRPLPPKTHRNLSPPDDVKKIRDKKLEQWSRNDKYDDRTSSQLYNRKKIETEQQYSKSQPSVSSIPDKAKQRRSSTPDWDAEIEEELKVKGEKNKLNKRLECLTEYHSPRSVESYSSSREKSLEKDKDRKKDRRRHRKHRDKHSKDRDTDNYRKSRWDVDDNDSRDKFHSKHRHYKHNSSTERTKDDHHTSRPKLSPPPSLPQINKYLDDIESSESCSLSPINSSDSNMSIGRTVKVLKGDDLQINFQSEKTNSQKQKDVEENLMKVNLNSASTSSVKSLKGEDLTIQIQNANFKLQKTNNIEDKTKKLKSATVVSSPSIKDVLKSPPLSANDIDDLLHDSGPENVVDVAITKKSDLSEVRKKLAKITEKLNQSSNINENKNKEFEFDSLDKEKQFRNSSPVLDIKASDRSVLDVKSNDRLALKYHPHVKKNSNNFNNASNNVESDPTILRPEKIPECISNYLKTSPNLNLNNINSIINTFPTLNPNDPRLRNKPQMQECMKSINETYPNLNAKDLNKSHMPQNVGIPNVAQNIGQPIPSLLNKIISNPLGNLIQPNVKMNFPPNLIDIPLQVNIPLTGSALQTITQQQQQQLQPLVTIPKSTFTDFIKNKNHLNPSSSKEQMGYNKINPIQNDNFERQKYLESKKSKDCLNTNPIKGQNIQPKTYGEYRRQCELEKNKTSKIEINKLGKNETVESKETIKNNDVNLSVLDDQQTNQSLIQNKECKYSNNLTISKLPRQLSKRRDSLVSKIESDKHSKVSHFDSQSNKTSTLHSTNNLLKNSSSTSQEIGSISKFKIPKKNKDDETKDEYKIEAETGSKKSLETKKKAEVLHIKDSARKIESHIDKKNIESENQNNLHTKNKPVNEGEVDYLHKNKKEPDYKTEEKIDICNKSITESDINVDQNIKNTSKHYSKPKRKFVSLKSEESGTGSLKIFERRKSMTSLPTPLKDLGDNIIEESKSLRGEEPKIELSKVIKRRKSVPAVAVIDNSINLIDTSNLSKILDMSEKESEEKSSNEILVIKDDTESLRSFDTTDSTSVSSQQSKKKSKRSGNYYYYEVAPDPVDNTKLSTDNIIEGKRRSRSLVNMNESSLAPPKYVSKNKTGNSSVESSDSSKDSNIIKEKNITKKTLKSENINVECSDLDDNVIFEPDLLKSFDSTSKTTAVSNQNKKVEQNVSTSEISSDIDSKTIKSLLNILDPNSKKENLLEVLSKVCDEKKFEKIKAILEEDDKPEQSKCKTESVLEERIPVESTQEMNITEEEEVVIDNSKDDNNSNKLNEKINLKSDKKIKYKTELDRLNEDIRDMFISQGVLSAFGKRNHTQINKINESTNSKNLGISNKSIKIYKSKQVKVMLKKLNFNFVTCEKSPLKMKSHPKRRRRTNWARGFITKKKSPTSTSLSGEKVNKATKKTGLAIMNPNPSRAQTENVNSSKTAYCKPCPKSRKLSFLKKQYYIDNLKESVSKKLKTTFLENDVVPVKNIYSDMHAKSDYCKKCLICHKNNIHNLVLHYIDAHPLTEVFISRLPPDTLQDLSFDRNNSALYQYANKLNNVMFHYRCPFCDIQQTATKLVWLSHFTTHTGEFHYKCSGCSKHSNMRNTIQRHIRTNCSGSHVIYKDQFPGAATKNSILGYLCNLCNYVQLLHKNVVKHLTTQHSFKEKKNYRTIVLMDLENIPKLDKPPAEETQILVESNSNEGASKDEITSKEQVDLDKNLLNYMSGASFSDQNPKSNEIRDETITHDLGVNIPEKNKEIAVCPEKKQIEINAKEKNISFVDLLSQRLQNLTNSNASEKEKEKEKEKSIDNAIDYDNETAVIYILDKIDDDNLDNIELVESSEQVVVPINKPISNSRANILDKIGGSCTSQLNLTESDTEITDSIYATLNEKLKNSKSPDKKITTINKNKKSIQKKPGIAIIDRLNKRLKEATQTKAIVDESESLNKSKKNIGKKSMQHLTDNEDRNALDSSDDNLVIDEDYIAPSLPDTNNIENNTSTSSKETTNKVSRDQQNDINVVEDDDDCWEDIEEITPQLNECNENNNENNLKIIDKNQQSKEKNKTILKTLSKIYVSFGKNKQKKKKCTDVKNSRSATPSGITDESCDSNIESNSSKQSTQQQPIPLADLISDAAIPSPISTELITDPPVPLPSEPLSDLNDISAILEPGAVNSEPNAPNATNSNSNIITTTELTKIGAGTSAVHTVNIHDINEPIYVLPDNVTFADAIALATEIENTKKSNKNENKIDSLQQISNKCIKTPVTFRINNLGFSECNGKVKYFCLIKPCSFIFSDQEIGLQNHYSSDHKKISWDGYCYACEANISSEDELPLDRELKHMTEVHIKNLLKSQNLCVENNQNSDSSKSFEETLMTNRPKITIRRLSGDLLSKSKPTESVKEPNHLQLPVQTLPISVNDNVNLQLSKNICNISNVTRNNNVTPFIIDPKLNLANISKQNCTIKDLLEIPSIPPPILPQLLADESSNSKSSPTGTIHTTTLQRLQAKPLSTKPQTITFSNIDKSSTGQPTNKSNLPVSPIQNNLNSGSGLKISSVSQGVTIADKEISSSVISSPIQISNNSEQLKIISVTGGITSNQSAEQLKVPKIVSNITLIPVGRNNEVNPSSPIHLINPAVIQPLQPQLISSDIQSTATKASPKASIQTQNLSKPNAGFLRIENVCSLSSQNSDKQLAPPALPQNDANLIDSSINTESRVVSVKESLSTTTNNTEEFNNLNNVNNSELNLNQPLTSPSPTSEISQSIMKVIKPWLFPTISKPLIISQYQLRAISLYALFKCMNQQCFFTTNSSESIMQHFQYHEKNSEIHHGSTIIRSNNLDWLRCSYCNFIACNPANYVEHINSIHSHDIFQCCYCFYRSCNDFNVLKHIEEYHKEMKKVIFVCHGERKRLASEMKHLAIYRNKHIKPIPCFDCNKKFFILRNYLKHILEHNVDNECYTCAICNANGLLKKCADTHLSLVHRISVYQCIYCDMSSNLRNIMVVHMAKEHPSNLLYSCVRVSPNKNTIFSTETIENSTVLANLNENVNIKLLQYCNFSIENLNFMNPALDPQAIEQNKNIKISVNFPLTNPAVPTTSVVKVTSDVPTPNLQQSLKIASVTSLAPSTLSVSVAKPQEISTQTIESNGSTITPVSPNQQNILPSYPVKISFVCPNAQNNSNSNLTSPSSAVKSVITKKVVPTTKPISCSNLSDATIDETITIDDSDIEDEENTEDSTTETVSKGVTKNISEILKNCTALTKSVALAQEKQGSNSVLIDKQLVSQSAGAKIVQKTPLNFQVNQKCLSSDTLTDTLIDVNDDLSKKIIEAAQDYVLDTGYDTSDLYRCSFPECVNIKLDCDTLTPHYSQKHTRLKQFKCPHCTCQYSNLRSLKGHLATHKRHRYFCFFCNQTSSYQQHLTKHMTDLHNKHDLVCFPLTAKQLEFDAKDTRIFFVIAPIGTKQNEILEFGEKLVRICERKRSLAKKYFNPNEIDQLPFQAIFNTEVFCSVCSYKTKVRANIYRHLLFHKNEVKVNSIDPVNPVPCLVSNEKNFDKMINMALSSNLNKDKNEKPQSNSSSGIEFSDTIVPPSDDDIKEALKKAGVTIPEFIPLMRRFICGVPSCNYLTITDYMLKCHLQTLHSKEKNYKCPHCKIDILQKKTFCSEKILQHLKFHDSKIYLCGECYYMHFLKHVVERHVIDRHSSVIQVDIIQFERKDNETIVTKQSCGRSIGTLAQTNAKTTTSDNSNNRNESNIDETVTSTILDNVNKSTPTNKLSDIEETKWICTTCKFKTVDEPSMINHINSTHNIRFRYGCLDCKFGACQLNLVKEHITEKHHTFQQRQVKSNYYRLDESDNDIVHENRPLWTRSDPYRIKHIRGILVEEEESGKSTEKMIKKSNKVKKSSSGNSSTVGKNNISATGKSKRKSLERKASQNSLTEVDKIVNTANAAILIDSSSSSQDSSNKTINKNSKVKTSLNESLKNVQSTSTRSSSVSSSRDSLEENLTIVTSNDGSTSTVENPENVIEIYECYYCPTKNISFKVIYTHWLLHHCKKINEKSGEKGEKVEKSEKITPLIAKPFAFKVVGYIGADSIEISTYDITKNQLNRFLKMGQRVTRFQCNKCWRLFANSLSVADHQKKEHANISSQSTHRCLTFKNRNFFICNSCGYASSLECKTAAHLLNHYDGLKKCTRCNQVFDKFLEFIRHLPKHNITFKEFLQMDTGVKDFWNKIIILFPNGLCMMRCNLPKTSKLVLDDLLDIVTNEVEAALIQTAPQPDITSKSNDNIEQPFKDATTEDLRLQNIKYFLNKELERKSGEDEIMNVENNSINISRNDSLDTIDRISLDSENSNNNLDNNLVTKSIPSTSKNLKNSDSLSLSNNNDNNIEYSEIKLPVLKLKPNKKLSSNVVKHKRKYEKDGEWTPNATKKRKKIISTNDQFDSSSSTDNDDDFDDDFDDDMPLVEVLQKNPSIQKLEKPKIKPFIGPKCTQKKYHNSMTPYSYYGNKPIAEDLNTLTVKVRFDISNEIDDDDDILLTCQQYAEIVPINCYVIVEKLNPTILQSKTINLFKLKTQNNINDDSNSIIEDSSDSSSSLVKRRKLSKTN